MKKIIMFLLVCFLCILQVSAFAESKDKQQPKNKTKVEVKSEKFEWGKYYEVADTPFELAINSYEKSTLDLKVKDPMDGNKRLKVVPSLKVVYFYEKNINTFGGWECVHQDNYADDSFVARLVNQAFTILKEAGIVDDKNKLIKKK